MSRMETLTGVEDTNLLQACINKVASKLTKMPLVNTVHLQTTKLDLPDVIFTSSIKSPGDCGNTLLTAIEAHANDFNYSEAYTILEESSFKVSEVVARLPEDSEGWPLSIDRCVLKRHRVLISLNRRQCFSTLIPHVLSRGRGYGRRHRRRAQVALTCESLPEARDDLSLKQLRLQYLAVQLRNVLEASGYDVREDGESCSERLHLTSRSQRRQSPDSHTGVLLAGNVTARQGGQKLHLSATEFLKRRHQDVSQLAGERSADAPAREEHVSRLADAVVKLELLQARPTSEVNVLLCDPRDNPRLRGALFVLYNYARVAAILRQFDGQVRAGVYPPLVPVGEADFSLLTQQEEWCLMSRYVLTFPHLVETCVGSLQSAAPHRICLFLAELSRVYSAYYRRVRVLTEPREHMLPVMFARLYLLKAVEQVFSNALALLDVTPPDYM